MVLIRLTYVISCKAVQSLPTKVILCITYLVAPTAQHVHHLLQPGHRGGVGVFGGPRQGADWPTRGGNNFNYIYLEKSYKSEKSDLQMSAEGCK